MFTVNTRRVPADQRVLALETTPVYFRCIRERSALRNRETEPVAATIPFPPLEAHPLTQRVGGFCPRCAQWQLRETDVAVVNSATLATEQRYTVADCVCGHEDITR